MSPAREIVAQAGLQAVDPLAQAGGRQEVAAERHDGLLHHAVGTDGGEAEPVGVACGQSFDDAVGILRAAAVEDLQAVRLAFLGDLVAGAVEHHHDLFAAEVAVAPQLLHQQVARTTARAACSLVPPAQFRPGVDDAVAVDHQERGRRGIGWCR